MCSVLNCNEVLYCKCFCKRHYDKNRRHGDPLYERKLKKSQPCLAASCLEPVWAKGLCPMHLMQKRRADSPEYRKREVASTRAWKKRNPELDAKHQAAYGRKHAKQLYESRTRWRKANWDYYLAYLHTQKKRTKQATPPWQDNSSLVRVFQNRPKGTHVDHIIPLTHPQVCGLNVPWNLQYLSEADNLSKSNKFDGTYENEGWRKAS